MDEIDDKAQSNSYTSYFPNIRPWQKHRENRDHAFSGSQPNICNMMISTLDSVKIFLFQISNFAFWQNKSTKYKQYSLNIFRTLFFKNACCVTNITSQDIKVCCILLTVYTMILPD